MKWIPWIISLLLMLGTEAWFLWPGENWKFEWEPLLAFVAASGAFLVVERKNLKPITSKQIAESDIELFKVLYRPFQYKGALAFFRDHDFGGPYLADDVAPLLELASESVDFERAFLNPRIEKCRKSMQSSAFKLKSLLAKHTFELVDRNDVFRRVYPDLDPHNAIRENAVNAINHAATEFYKAYEKYYNTARTELGGQIAL